MWFWGIPVQVGGSLCGLGSLYRFGASLYSWGVPVRFGRVPVLFGVPVQYWGGGGVPVYFGVPVQFWGGGPCKVWSPVWFERFPYGLGTPPGVSRSPRVSGPLYSFGGPWTFRGSPCVSPRALPRCRTATRESSRPAGVAVAAGGGGVAGPGGSRLFRRRVVSAARRRHSGSRNREWRGSARLLPARPVPAMWFIYVLSWLSLLIQVAFVTLAIGEPAVGGLPGCCRAGLGPGPASPGGCRDMSCVSRQGGMAPGRGQPRLLLGPGSEPPVQHPPWTGVRPGCPEAPWVLQRLGRPWMLLRPLSAPEVLWVPQRLCRGGSSWVPAKSPECS